MSDFKRVVIIDDSETTILLNRHIIDECFPMSEVLSFNNSKDFLALYMKNKSWQNTSMLLLLDIHLPDISGYDVLEELEEDLDDLDDLDHLHVIMVTASNLRRDWERSTRFPYIIGYIEKPLTRKSLGNALKTKS